MTRPKLFLLVGIAFTAVAVIVVGVIVTVLVLRYSQPGPVPERLSEHALTPQETVTEVAPRTDGTVQIRQRLIIETPPADEGQVGNGSVRLWITTAGLGKNPQTGKRMSMLPKISSLSAVELSTSADSTQASPKTLGELDIAVEEEKEPGFDYPEAHFSFSPKDSDGEAGQWSEGRHVIELEYVFDNVFLTVAGEEFFAIPVPSIGNSYAALERNVLRIDTDGPVHCPADNVDFELGDACALGTTSTNDDSTEVVWRKSYTDSRKVFAFSPPSGTTVTPTTSYERP
ncbi:hypothetical protein BI49514_00761 [Brevibacterium iodinum ATCC 49514]|uniref:Uncharacterized protein n=1 Tax=Brevibacterium iodinum ATCC 49514 TaxID=1255616 RepID=A0A2H1IB65_9MICO|nr:hypothetical protein [Brevibacterium iodinum]SMX72461.1 hypothetical protein BI49514_00761 [Brevibacterium iodinum ATCC 49514]SUW13170.1 Uncharacterised protein [Brevibacterium iodinum]